MKPGEAFSSWIHRAAYANGMADHTFCRHLFGQRAIWNRDVDHLADDAMICAAATALVEDQKRLFNGTLRSLENVLSDRKQRGGHFPWVLSLGVYHRLRRRHGQQYCALCLSDGNAWLRLRWRLAWFVYCPEHERLLRDSCPHCDAPLHFHRMSLAIPGRLSCPGCGGNVLSGSSDDLPKPQVIRLQRKMIHALEGRPVNLGKERIEPQEFLRGVRTLAIGVYPKRYWSGLVDGLSIIDLGQIPAKPAMNIEHWRIRPRTFTMETLGTVLDRWPNRFRKVCIEGGVIRARFEPNGRESHPQWIESALRQIERLPTQELRQSE